MLAVLSFYSIFYPGCWRMDDRMYFDSSGIQWICDEIMKLVFQHLGCMLFALSG